MLITNTNFIFVLKNNQNNFFTIVICSYEFGLFFFKIIKGKFCFLINRLNCFFQNIKIKLNINLFNNSCLGLNLLYNYKLQIFGSNLKITKKHNTFVLRTGKANKCVILPLQNFKLFLIKKTIVNLIARHFNFIKLFSFKWKSYYLKTNYKKKGLYFKNEIVTLKLGKITKL